MNQQVIEQGKRKTLNITAIAIALMGVCSLLTGVAPQMILSIGILIGSVLLFLDGNLYLGYPFVMFYYELYGRLFGLSVYRIYTLLLLFLALLSLVRGKGIRLKYLPVLIVYFFYTIAVMLPISPQRAIFSFVDIICCMFLIVAFITQDEKKLKSFFRVYVLVAVLAFVTGLIGGNTMVYEEIVGESAEITRYMATFEDPNYMGYFYTSAIFALVVLKLFHPKLRFLLVIALYLMILSTVSMTAIVVNVALWLFYLFLMKKMNIRAFAVSLIVVALFVGFYRYGLTNPDAAIWGSMSMRIEEKLLELNRGDIGAVTTGRTDLSAEHLAYFTESSFLKKLFGGTAINTSFVDPALSGAAHNEYIDWLLNIGLLGTLIMAGFLIYSFFGYWKKAVKEKNDVYAFLAMIKANWMFYAATLTIFLDFRFMLLFFI